MLPAFDTIFGLGSSSPCSAFIECFGQAHDPILAALFLYRHKAVVPKILDLFTPFWVREGRGGFAFEVALRAGHWTAMQAALDSSPTKSKFLSEISTEHALNSYLRRFFGPGSESNIFRALVSTYSKADMVLNQMKLGRFLFAKVEELGAEVPALTEAEKKAPEKPADRAFGKTGETLQAYAGRMEEWREKTAKHAMKLEEHSRSTKLDAFMQELLREMLNVDVGNRKAGPLWELEKAPPVLAFFERTSEDFDVGLSGREGALRVLVGFMEDLKSATAGAPGAAANTNTKLEKYASRFAEFVLTTRASNITRNSLLHVLARDGKLGLLKRVLGVLGGMVPASDRRMEELNPFFGFFRARSSATGPRPGGSGTNNPGFFDGLASVQNAFGDSFLHILARFGGRRALDCLMRERTTGGEDSTPFVEFLTTSLRNRDGLSVEEEAARSDQWRSRIASHARSGGFVNFNVVDHVREFRKALVNPPLPFGPRAEDINTLLALPETEKRVRSFESLLQSELLEKANVGGHNKSSQEEWLAYFEELSRSTGKDELKQHFVEIVKMFVFDQNLLRTRGKLEIVATHKKHAAAGVPASSGVLGDYGPKTRTSVAPPLDKPGAPPGPPKRPLSTTTALATIPQTRKELNKPQTIVLEAAQDWEKVEDELTGRFWDKLSEISSGVYEVSVTWFDIVGDEVGFELLKNNGAAAFLRTVLRVGNDENPVGGYVDATATTTLLLRNWLSHLTRFEEHPYGRNTPELSRSGKRSVGGPNSVHTLWTHILRVASTGGLPGVVPCGDDPCTERWQDVLRKGKGFSSSCGYEPDEGIDEKEKPAQGAASVCCKPGAGLLGSVFIPRTPLGAVVAASASGNPGGGAGLRGHPAFKGVFSSREGQCDTQCWVSSPPSGPGGKGVVLFARRGAA